MGGVNYYKGKKKIKPIIAKCYPIANIDSVKKIKYGRETYIRATKSLVEVFEDFEQAWIKLYKSKID